MDDDERPSRREKKSFLSGSQAVYLVIFLLGFAIGAVLTNQYIDPALNSGFVVEKTALEEKNRQLDLQADSCIVCLQNSGIDPQTCQR